MLSVTIFHQNAESVKINQHDIYFVGNFTSTGLNCLANTIKKWHYSTYIENDHKNKVLKITNFNNIVLSLLFHELLYCKTHRIKYLYRTLVLSKWLAQQLECQACCTTTPQANNFQLSVLPAWVYSSISC